MSALELLENRTRLDAHLDSHAFAERIYEHVRELIESGSDPVEIRDAMRELHRRARAKHQVKEGMTGTRCVDRVSRAACYPEHIAIASGAPQ